MAVLSKFYKIATVKNTTFAAVAVAVLWTLARKASANQRRRFSCLPVCIERCHFSYAESHYCCVLGCMCGNGQIAVQWQVAG